MQTNKNKIQNLIELFLIKNKKWKRWQKIVSSLACLVVFITTYFLILPAITMEKNPYCGYEEHIEHSDSAGCYEEIKTLTCKIDPTVKHSHGDSCYEISRELTCGIQESEGHSHGDGCYDEDGNLTCDKAESTGHSHDKDCYTEKKTLICKKEEGAHKHKDSCYKTDRKLVCEKELHTHTESCFSNPKADVEDKADWEKSVSKVKLTGKWEDDVLAIAHSQLGYKESTKNYIVNEAGKKKGYTRYGAWYGDPYGDWCAMYVSFCLTYADVDRDYMPVQANCQRWIEILSDKDRKQYHAADSGYEPKPGDLIFFDWDDYKDDEARVADHIGLVAELKYDKKDKLIEIKTIEGNASDMVQYKDYEITNKSILGYGELPENPNYVDPAAADTSLNESDEQIQGTDKVLERDESQETEGTETVSNETVEDPEENASELTEEESEDAEVTESETEDEDSEDVDSESETTETELSEDETSEDEEDAENALRYSKEYKGSDYIVTVAYSDAAQIPDDAELLAEEYDKKSKIYKERYAEAAMLYGWSEEEDYSEEFRLFNIGFWQREGVLGFLGLNKTEVEPQAEVQVTIIYKDQEKLPRKGFQITHFGDEETKTIRTGASPVGKDAAIEFVTDGFSDYSVMPLADDDGIMLLAAGDSESNLLAYFKFDGNLNDSSGNGAGATMTEGNPGYGYTTTVSGQSLKLSDEQFGKYLTITDKNGNSLLKGYDEVTFDFYMYPTKSSRNTGNGHSWPIFAAPNSNNISSTNRRYIGLMHDVSEYTVEGHKYNGGGRNTAGTATGSNITNSRWYHVRIDYTNEQTVLKITNSSGNTTYVNQTISNTASITDLFANGGILQIGKANWGNGEFFDGYLDEFKIYGKMADNLYHVCSDDEIAHVSLDGRADWHWRENTTDDTGKAAYQNRTSSTRNNALAEGDANVAPVQSIQGNIYPVSAKMVATEKDHLTITGNPTTTNLIKGKNYSEFAFDFWMEPTAKGSSDNTDFGLFEIGSYVSGGSRQTLTAVMPKNNNNPKQIILAAPDNKSIVINLSESIINQWVHVYVTYSGTEATLWVENADGKVLGKGTLNTGLTVSGLFNQYSAERIAFANVKNTNYFNGFMDEIIFYNQALTVPGEEISGDPNHPRTAITENIRATGVGLYNVNTKGGEAEPLAGVEYTVYKSDGSVYGTYTTIDEFVLYLGILPPGTYTIEQTDVPEGYVLVPQTKTFTVSSSEDNLTQAGIFYDYYSGDSFDPSKKGEVYDYENRIYDIILSAKSGSFQKVVDPKNFNFVVDQSNSMLFPAVLTDTGARVTLHSVNDGNSSTWQNDASGNSRRLDDVMASSGLDPNKLYYIKALDATKATVYAVWKSADGHWYAQDAAYYAQAQAGVHHDSQARNYQYADTPAYTDNNTKVVDGGGCLDGINREAHETGKGNSISGMSDLWQDIQEFGTANNNVSNNAGTDHYKSYVIYTGSEMNRLTYLKYAIKRLIYQLASMDSKNQVTITSFDKYVEGCMTREVDTANPQGLIDLVTFVDGIQTAGGTAQNYGIAHILGDHATNGNKTSCPGGHLNYTVDGKKADDYIVLITDGALNNSNGYRVYSSSDSGATETEKQELDLKAGANKFKQNATNPKLITIGLSVQDVTWGKQLLSGTGSGGIATEGYSFLDIDADELAITLSNALIDQLIELEKVDDYANIRDYISDSFYLVDTDGTELAVKDWINLSGQKVSSTSTDRAGQVDKDDNGWYVEWKNQTLGDGLAGSSGGTYTKYSYRDDRGTVTENLNTDFYYIIDYYNGRAITGSATSRDSSRDMLYFDQSTGKWTYWWRVQNGNYNRKDDPGTRITSTTAQGSPIWQGKIYVKAKEDFIGGNVIDANKTFVSEDGRQVTEGAQISLLESQGSNNVINTIQLPTPTLNVRLLPIEGFESEETVFLGDHIFPENTDAELQEKLQTLLEKTVVNKIKFGLQDPLNKSGMGEDDGVFTDHFTIPYAIRELTEDEWSALRNGDSVRVDYTYDDASSHGAVGYFEFRLTQEGDKSDYDDHISEEIGEDVEQYILKVTYTAYKKGEEDQDGIKRREANVHYTSKGPGTEVGGSNAGNTLETGKGTESVDEIHHVHVIDGEIFLTKVIDESLISDQDQTFTFNLYVKGSESEDSDADAVRTVTVTVPAGETQGTIHITDLPRNNYIVKESSSDDYAVTEVEVVNGDTTCQYETSMPTLEFDIGTNMNSNGTNPDHNVILFNDSPPLYENSMWVNGERYVYSKPFMKTKEDNTGSEGDSTYPRPGYHLEDREVEVYAWESGTIISNDTSGAQYTKLNGTTASLDAAHTNYGVLTQNPENEDNWTVTWTNWTSKEDSTTTYDWPEGTLISTNTSGSQYVKLNGTTSSLDASHTSYGILKKNSSGNWVIEWHTWTQTSGSSSSGNNVTIHIWNWRYGSQVRTITVPANQPVTITYTIDNANTNPTIWTGGSGYNWQATELTKTKVSGTSNRYTTTFTPTQETWFAYSYDDSNSVSTFISSSGVPTWSQATRTENATTSKLPTTTTTNTTWTKGTSTAAADSTKIPKTTKIIQVEVEDEPEEPDPGTGTVVESVTITKLSAGHGVITNTEARFEADIPVQKKWDDNGTHEDDVVYVVLVNQDGSPVVDDEGIAKLLRLDSTNEFTGKFTIPIPYKDYDPIQDGHYGIREVYKIQDSEFTDSTKAMLTGDQADTTLYYVALATENTFVTINEVAYNVHYSTDEGDVLVVENQTTYELPESGGVGTNRFTLGGLLLMSISLLYGFILRRKRERRIN